MEDTEDENVHFDWTSHRWYRHDPRTRQSVYLNPQPPAPRTYVQNQRDADQAFNSQSHASRSGQSGGYATDRRLSHSTTSSTSPTLVSSLRNMSMQDYTHTRQVEDNDPSQTVTWNSHNVSQDEAIPQVEYGEPEHTTDPALAAEGGIARARVRGVAPRHRGQFLDKEFMVRKNGKKFFIPGRVIKVFWPELAGRVDSSTNVTFTSTRFRDVQMIGKIRWFIVIMTGHNACTCLPISTYGRQGVAKPGVRKWEHCIVYTERAPPQPMYGEAPGANEQPMRTAIRVKPSVDGDVMESESRLNYAKMYTVEHNVRVYDFGMVRPEFLQILTTQWRQILDRYSGASAASVTPSNAYSGATSSRSGEQDSQRPKTPELPSMSPPRYMDYGYATESYAPPQSEDRQISVEQNDRLAIIDWPYADWANAYNQTSGETGLVPYNRVKLYESAEAQYTWSSTEHGYVDITRGDSLKILDIPHAGWAQVWNLRTAETGLVPQNYYKKTTTGSRRGANQ